MKLDVGAGDYPLPGFTAVDGFNPNAQVHAPLWDLPFPDHSVEIVHSSHSLEHVPGHQVPLVLTEWKRVLHPAGELWLEVPDLDWVCAYWLRTGGNRQFALAVIFGMQTDPGQYHQTGFNAPILQACLAEAGFELAAISDTHPPEGAWAAAPPPWDTTLAGQITRVWSHGQECLRARVYPV